MTFGPSGPDLPDGDVLVHKKQNPVVGLLQSPGPPVDWLCSVQGPSGASEPDENRLFLMLFLRNPRVHNQQDSALQQLSDASGVSRATQPFSSGVHRP